MRVTLIIAGIVIALRVGLHYAGFAIGPMEFVPVHLLAVIAVAYLSGFLLLRHDPSRGMAELIRNGLRDTALYAVVIAVFIYIFYRYIDASEFPERNAQFIANFVAEGHTEAEAREKVERFYTPGGYAGVTFFGMLLLGVFNTLIFGALHHKVLRRFRR
ncbi:MAG: hypothetical protein QM724_11180 [Flavobacteriales bacterium]